MNAILFSESHSRFVVSIKPENKTKFDSILGDEAILLGKVNSTKRLIINQSGEKIIEIKMDKLQEAWEKGFL